MTGLGFDALISPLKRAAFLGRYFGLKAAVLRGNAERFLALDRSLGGLEAFVQASSVQAATVDRDGLQREIAAAPDQLESLRAAGMTLCADVSRDPEVAELLAKIHSELRLGAGVGFAKLYWSPPGKGFAPHFDPHHVFVLQLSGHKRWWFSDTPAVPWASDCGCAAPQGHAIYSTGVVGRRVVDPDGSPVAVPQRGDLRVETLHPGDVLYLAPGTWHTTEATQDSRALSLSPARLSPAQIVMDLLARRLEGSPAWAADLAGPQDLDQRLSDGLAALRAAVADLHPSQLRHAWAKKTFDATLANAPPSSPKLTITRATSFVRVETMARVDVLGADETVIGVALVRDGVELAFPPQASRFVDGLVTTPKFTGRESMRWDPQMTWDSTAAALQTLLQFGFVTAVV